MIVMKFGGSSLASADKVRRCVGLVRRELARRPVVVVSAHGRTTNLLIEAARRALDGKVDLSAVERIHADLCRDLGVDFKVAEPLLAQLSAVLHGVSLLKELTPRTLDQVMSFGERMSTRIVASAMEAGGVAAAAVNAYDAGLLTDSNHGHAAPLPGIDDAIGRALCGMALVPVVTGFLGKDKKGDITTLGRSGSDFSASIVGAAIGAEEIQIWTDVNGVMTADPSVDPQARNLPVLSFTEASELAYYGAEVLHPNTLVPAIRKKIPVRVLNTLRPEDEGTVILAEPALGNRIAKSVVYKEDVCLINVTTERLMSAAKVLAAAIGILDARGVGVHLAATSEATVSMVTDRAYGDEELGPALEELGRHGAVAVERDLAILCVVGEEMRGRAGAAGKILTVLGETGVNARMISQSASELNVAVLVDNAAIEPAVKALHRMLLGS
ncbi:MAG: aspartate kinase [Deltaproteobacteria bacterium]|nr:aspartate kinase [Deltaproteobacteria bacterium]